MNKYIAKDIAYAIVEIHEDTMTPGQTWKNLFKDTDAGITNRSDAYEYFYSGFIEGQGGHDTLIEWLEGYEDEDWFGRKCMMLAEYIKENI